MASRLNPYLGFTDNARAALDFYQDVFGGELTVTTFAGFGGKDSPIADLVMHGMLETDSGYTIMCADNPPSMPERQVGNNVAVCLNGVEGEELHRYWDKLIVGGTVHTPLEKQMWGDEFGSCQDKFGIPWMVNITLPQS
jgi:PhnB protein